MRRGSHRSFRKQRGFLFVPRVSVAVRAVEESLRKGHTPTTRTLWQGGSSDTSKKNGVLVSRKLTPLSDIGPEETPEPERRGRFDYPWCDQRLTVGRGWVGGDSTTALRVTVPTPPALREEGPGEKDSDRLGSYREQVQQLSG